MKNITLIGYAFLIASAVIPVQAEELDDAPSGNEQNEILASPTGTEIGHPGKDSPVTQTKEGNKEKLDFNDQRDSANTPADFKENDTSIIHDE